MKYCVERKGMLLAVGPYPDVIIGKDDRIARCVIIGKEHRHVRGLGHRDQGSRLPTSRPEAVVFSGVLSQPA